MQILNLTNVEKSDIKYSISSFPDGEIQITLGEFSHKDEVRVVCRITSANDLFLLMQVNDILTRHGVEWDMRIMYLMGARMDRVMDFNRPYTLKVILDVLKGFSCNYISVLEPHSYKAMKMDNGFSGETCGGPFDPYLSKVYGDWTVVFPDKGAYERYGGAETHRHGVVICEKTRDVTTGELKGFKVTNPEVILNSTKPLLIIDDLCDGGGTFCGIAAEIRKIRPDVKLNIFVTHMVNPKGIENLSKNFDHVWFTNSYKNWNGLKAEFGKVVPTLPENVTQIDVI